MGFRFYSRFVTPGTYIPYYPILELTFPDGARALVQFGVDWNKAQPSVASHLDFGEGLRVWVTKVKKTLLINRDAYWIFRSHAHGFKLDADLTCRYLLHIEMRTATRLSTFSVG